MIAPSLPRPASTAELAALLRDQRGPVRLCGRGSRQHRLADAAGALRIDLTGFAGIERLDAPDQTCTVGAGLRRDLLDAALAEHGLELPCLGGGTLGGLFASDPLGPATTGGGAPRTLLLGLRGVTADGTPFQSGAQVVKSVAGFDVHKLLVGSRGTLFAATHLHLRLKPRPRAEAWFALGGLDLDGALARWHQLLALPVPPTRLHLLRTAAGVQLHGRLGGRPGFVTATQRALDLPEAGPFAILHLDPPRGGEVLTGTVVPDQLRPLLAAAPADAPFLLHGGGRFELALPAPGATDGVLAACTTHGIPACIAAAAPTRRGHGTPLDPGQLRIAAACKRALDPHGILV